MTKALVLRGLTRVGLDSDQESSLEVCERVEVEEEVVDLVLGDDIVRLDLALIILRPVLHQLRPARTYAHDTHLKNLEVLHVFPFAVENLADDHRAVVAGTSRGCRFDGEVELGMEHTLVLEYVEQLGHCVDDLRAEAVSSPLRDTRAPRIQK
jgi:hypothetical protein